MDSKTDVLIMGGGIGGTAVARELSKYELDVTLVEKEADVGWGQSKASYAIYHPGARWAIGTLAQEMIAKSHTRMDQLIDHLDIQLRRCGELVLAFDKEEIEYLKALKTQGERNHVDGLEIIDKDKIKHLEPNVNPAAVAALYMPTSGVFNPFEMVFAFYENARENGVHMLMATEVTGIIPEKRKFIVKTNRADIEAKYIVNTAGLYAARMAKMVAIDDFEISYNTKSSCLILDNRVGNVVKGIVTGIADLNAFTRFKLVMPTFHKNILLYTPISEPSKGIADRAVEKRIFDLTFESARQLVPGVDFERHIIASFSGLTARNNRGDFIIEASERYPTFINVALPPPGITSSPAIARKVADILRKSGLTLTKKTDFNPHRKRIKTLRDSSPEEVEKLVRQDPSYGDVVCRCEKVSEKEIIEAVKRGATTLDGIKFRTRAGMGRCQANFCGPRVVSILARELHCPIEAVTKKGAWSEYLIERRRQRYGQ